MYRNFPHYLIKGSNFGKKIIEQKICVLIFSATLSVPFLILGRIERDIIISLHRSVRKVPVILVRF